ncbi:hypothetical protein [uncultured Mucilaginibacter sp.]|uniref:hypothetical protein n=1 Tax=uncultured Mucilaginibacter sp. TaxID=797541 RepID=UPI0025EB527C|nr:hypothetical protein [uncultured Mucilaginibacter sp.]
MNTSTIVYSIKIWFTTAFVAPFLQCCINYIVNPPDFDAGYYIYAAVSVGVVLAIPSAVLFWLSTKFTKKIAFHTGLSKLFLTMPGILLTLVLIYFAESMPLFAINKLSLPIPYIVTVVAAIWLYELPVLDKRRYYETVNA